MHVRERTTILRESTFPTEPIYIYIQPAGGLHFFCNLATEPELSPTCLLLSRANSSDMSVGNSIDCVGNISQKCRRQYRLCRQYLPKVFATVRKLSPRVDISGRIGSVADTPEVVGDTSKMLATPEDVLVTPSAVSAKRPVILATLV